MKLCSNTSSYDPPLQSELRAFVRSGLTPHRPYLFNFFLVLGVPFPRAFRLSAAAQGRVCRDQSLLSGQWKEVAFHITGRRLNLVTPPNPFFFFFSCGTTLPPSSPRLAFGSPFASIWKSLVFGPFFWSLERPPFTQTQPTPTPTKTPLLFTNANPQKPPNPTTPHPNKTPNTTPPQPPHQPPTPQTEACPNPSYGMTAQGGPLPSHLAKISSPALSSQWFFLSTWGLFPILLFFRSPPPVFSYIGKMGD